MLKFVIFHLFYVLEILFTMIIKRKEKPMIYNDMLWILTNSDIVSYLFVYGIM